MPRSYMLWIDQQWSSRAKIHISSTCMTGSFFLFQGAKPKLDKIHEPQFIKSEFFPANNTFQQTFLAWPSKASMAFVQLVGSFVITFF